MRYVCTKCGHEVIADRTPTALRWSDGHVCHFRPANETPQVDPMVGKYFNYDGLTWSVEAIESNGDVRVKCITQSHYGIDRWFNKAFVRKQIG